MAEARLRRSLLMTPGNRPDRLRKATGYGADCLVFDLEDGVPPGAKAEARACVAAVLRELEPDGRERCVRINSLASGWGAEDLANLPLALIDSIMVPKVESAAELDAQAARELGFAGKVVFHPAQVAVVNRAFSPTPAEIARAQRIVSAWCDASARGHGTALAGGVFVAIDLVAPAQRLLRQAALVLTRDGDVARAAS